MGKFLEKLQSDYNGQDNRITAYPIIVLVQELVPVGVIDDEYSLLIDGECRSEPNVECDDCPIYDDCISADRGDINCKIDKLKMGYVWVTVAVCLTLPGAIEYIKLNGHHHRKLRTYIDHVNVRNVELRGMYKELGLNKTG